VPKGDLAAVIAKLRSEMLEAAQELAFERAAELRDQIRELEQLHIDLG
jgi:excinuclease ABC subunit B